MCAMLIVRPRSFSSGALSIWSYARNAIDGFCFDKIRVIADVKVVFPWSTCPIVPMFKCGFVLANFTLAILVLLAANSEACMLSEPTTRIELVTPSLPRMCSTY